MSNDIQKRNLTRAAEDTSVLELMEFTMAGDSFGINVAKVTEIMRYTPITPMTLSHPCIDGVFKPRGNLITVINLPRYMALRENEDPTHDMFMLTNFDNVNAAFLVHTVEGMHHINWSNVERPSSVVYGGNDSVVTGTTKIGNKIITIIDFEKVLYDINPETGLQISEVQRMGERVEISKPVVVVEDSVFLRRMLMESLELAGYSNITPFDNGQDAWEYLEKIRSECLVNITPIEKKASIIIFGDRYSFDCESDIYIAIRFRLWSIKTNWRRCINKQVYKYICLCCDKIYYASKI